MHTVVCTSRFRGSATTYLRTTTSFFRSFSFHVNYVLPFIKSPLRALSWTWCWNPAEQRKLGIWLSSREQHRNLLILFVIRLLMKVVEDLWRSWLLVWNADCQRFNRNGTFYRFFSSLKLKMSNISRGFDHRFFKILYSQPAVSFTLYTFESWVLHQVWIVLYFRLVRDHTESGKRVSRKIDIWSIGIGCASVVSLVLPLTSYCSVWSWS